MSAIRRKAPFWKSPVRKTQMALIRKTARIIRGAGARDINAIVRARSRSALAPEVKFYDTTGSVSFVASTDATGGEIGASMCCPAQGDGDQNRDGKKIICKYLEIRGSIDWAPEEIQANPPLGQQCFLALVLDTMTSGAQLNSEDVFKNLGASVSTATVPLRNLLFNSRFRVMKKETFDLNVNNVSHFAIDSFSHAGKRVNFEWFIPLRDLVVNYNAGTTAVVGSIQDNNLQLVGFGNSASCTISYNARLRFVG